jgi:glyceraldehyde 3-phosphate dehydrogenase
MVKFAINGFGRIGRNVLRACLQRQDLVPVAINDLGDIKQMAHLLKYDSIHGRFPAPIEIEDNCLIVNGTRIAVFSERDPKKLPWKELEVDVALECTGVFTTRDSAAQHLEAGAKRVLISAPANDADLTMVYGVNHLQFDPAKHFVLSNGSCTTNCLAPVAKVLLENFGIESGLMTTIHSYTNDQQILDLPHKDLRRARAASMSMIPTSTGAAKAMSLVIPELKGKLDGMAIRVPTPDVSIVDFVCTVQKDTTAEEVNQALTSAANSTLKGVLGATKEPLVSCDFIGSSESSVVDLLSTMVINKRSVKVLAWYDNEMGFSHRMNDVMHYISSTK